MTGTMTASFQYFSLPSDWLSTFSLAVIDPTTGDYEYLLNKDGIDLAPTSWADTYRSLEMQEYGFFQRYTDKPNKRLLKQKPKIYKGKAWYLRKGNAPLAVPGTSNHNLGIAIDIANASGKRLDWLLKNALDFGFSWELQSEPWHLRYTAGDNTPERVKLWKESKVTEA